MKDKIVKALLNQARYYGLLSKRVARAAKRAANSAQKQILEERAKKLLEVSQDYFQRAKDLQEKGGKDAERR